MTTKRKKVKFKAWCLMNEDQLIVARLSKSEVLEEKNWEWERAKPCTIIVGG